MHKSHCYAHICSLSFLSELLRIGSKILDWWHNFKLVTQFEIGGTILDWWDNFRLVTQSSPQKSSPGKVDANQTWASGSTDEMHNKVWSQVCRDLQCRVLHVYKSMQICDVKYALMYNAEMLPSLPDGIRLHLGMEILSLTTHLARPSGAWQEAVFWSGILVF